MLRMLFDLFFFLYREHQCIFPDAEISVISVAVKASV